MREFAEIIISSGTRMTDRPFTYEIPEKLIGLVEKGQSVKVPFGRGNLEKIGLVLNVFSEISVINGIKIENNEVKDNKVEDNKVEDNEVEDNEAKDKRAADSKVAINKIEDGTIDDSKIKKISYIVEDFPVLSSEAIGVAKYMIRENLSDYTSALSTVMSPGSVGEIKPVMRVFYSITETGRNAIPQKNAIKQKIILDLLKENESLEQAEILRLTGTSSSSLKSLFEKGWIDKNLIRKKRREQETFAETKKKKFTENQKKIYEKIVSKTGKYLICGVTGSGKTEIYLQLVEKTLEEGKSAIVLVPEISLTPQTIDRFEGRFPNQIAVLHSGLTTAQRYEEWEKIYSGEVKIAIGARSAIFAPFNNLGLIVIDEEHEKSYQSDRSPKYTASEIAELRCEYNNCSLVMGSATPSIESLYKVENGDWLRLNLPNRANNMAMPEIHIIDMREELKANNRTMFSRELYFAMREALSRKEQIILFLNKRGHTSYVFCRKCGYVYRCDACDVSMTYHKNKDRLICHYCGREKQLHDRCPSCGSEAIKEFGAGTELLEEEVRKYFPSANIVRADADTMRIKGAYNRVYHDMLNGKIDILLGTQMIAKGFDFPRVTVVGVVAADITLNIPDFRACERTFQLITQVAGRAGRGELPGNVYLQTYKPDQYAILAAANHDVDTFYKKEMEMRLYNKYPPYTTELHIGISSADRKCVIDRSNEIRKFLNEFSNIQIDGPAPSVIERINRRYRFGIMVRSNDREKLKEIGNDVMKEFPTSKELRIIVTLNPYSVF